MSKVKVCLLRIICTVVCFVFLFSVEGYAAEGDVGQTEDGYSYKELADGTLEITKYEYNWITRNNEVTIPSEINGKKITSIGDMAFYNCFELTKIVIPDGVKNIGFCAFDSCRALVDITIPDSVTNIEEFAFRYASFSSVTIPKNLEILQGGTFASCSNLKDIILPEGLKEIQCSSVTYQDNKIVEGRIGAFDCCGNLTTVSLPNTLTSIGEKTFSNCKSLTSIVIPNSVISLGRDMFCSCDHLESVTLPNQCKVIPYGMFEGCIALNNVIIPSSVEIISANAFADCEALEDIIFSEGLIEIERAAFYYCPIKELELPNSLEKLGESAFRNCDNIKEVVLPKNLSSFNGSAFPDCDNLKNYDVSSDNKKFISVDGIVFNKKKTELVVYPCGRKNDTYIIPASVKNIGCAAFSGNKILKNIIIPNGVTEIGSYAFSSTKMKTIILPDTVKSIGRYAFSAAAIEEISIPDKVKKIDSYVFDECEKLKFVEMSKNVKSISDDVFGEMSSKYKKKITVIAPKNSYAIKFAKKNDMKYSTKISPNLSKVKGVKVVAGKKSLTLKWKKTKSIDGYEIQFVQKNGAKKSKSYKVSSSSTSKSIAKLSKKKIYVISIRSYKKYENYKGKTDIAYSDWITVEKKTK